MSCIFRVCGDNLDIESLLSIVALQPDRVWRRGEPRRKNKDKVHTFSGATFTASGADFSEFDVQVEDATRFLEDNHQDVLTMVAFEGVEDVRLDFGIEFRDVAIHGDFLPNHFLRAAGAAGISVLLSHYPCPDEDDQSEQAGTGQPATRPESKSEGSD